MTLKPKFLVFALLIFLVPEGCINKENSAMKIVFWYGNNQQFGNQGISQPCINILGNISSKTKLKNAWFVLNGDRYHDLQIGPNNRRLQYPGDFNIELDTDCLLQGENTIKVIATDSLGNKGSQSIKFQYSPGKWELPYAVSWDTVSNIQNAVQVVDGEWKIDSSGATVIKPGYDRLLNVGDYTRWENYEITVKVTPHGLKGWVSVGLRWKGHYREKDEDHPYNGWNNAGCSGWIILHEKQLWYEYATGESNPQKMIVNIDNEIPFYWKMKVETVVPGNHLYSQRIWKTSEEEPTGWMEVLESPIDKFKTGSVYLLAHESGVTFGNFVVKELINP